MILEDRLKYSSKCVRDRFHCEDIVVVGQELVMRILGVRNDGVGRSGVCWALLDSLLGAWAWLDRVLSPLDLGLMRFQLL